MASCTKQQRPKLVVVIVIDQMRPDYLTRFYSDYGDGGFKKLMSDGFTFWNCNYNYVPTQTGPGHASIFEGCTPKFHIVTANDIYNSKTHRTEYCVSDSTYVIVGNEKKSFYTKKDSMQGMSPHKLSASNVCDELKYATNQKSKIISLSLKDRAAILPGGHLADYALWFDQKTGNFVTSSYYLKKLPVWVENFNKQKRADNIIKENKNQWSMLQNNDYYVDCDSTNEVEITPSEIIHLEQFPHNLLGSKSYSNFYHSPFGNTLLTDLAIETIKNTNIGKNSVPDILALSYSATDAVGHYYGPYSIEIKDTYLRLDKDLERLLNTLDETIGKDNYLIVLTADHGAPQLPKKQNNAFSGYINTKYLSKLCDEYLNRQLKISNPQVKWIDTIINEQIYLNQTQISKYNLQSKTIEHLLADTLVHQHGILYAFTASQLKEHEYSSGIGGLVQNGFNPALSGDIMLVLKSGYMCIDYSDNKVVIEHGSGWTYDTNVPLIFYGKNIPKGESWQLHYITDIAPTLSMILRIKYPSACMGNPISEINEK